MQWGKSTIVNMVEEKDWYKNPKNTDRIIFFSDAIFAVTITLLILTIPIPVKALNRKLSTDIVNTIPMFTSYIISFLIIGRFWIKHMLFFEHIKSFKMSLIWWNFLYLISVSFIPFPSAVYGTHYNDRFATVLYAGSIALAGFVSFFLWIYALRNGEILKKGVTNDEIIHHAKVSFVMPIGFLLSIIIAFIYLPAVVYVWILLGAGGSFLHRL